MQGQPKIKRGQDHFFFFFWLEVRRIIKAKPLLTIVCIYPVMIIFGLFYLFDEEIITKVPIAVVDFDKTQSSRMVIQDVSANPAILVTSRENNLSAAKDQLLRGNVFGVLLIPEEFEKKMLGGQDPEVTAFANMQYMSMGLMLSTGFTQALSTTLAEIQSQNSQVAMPIRNDLHPVFNPTLNYIFTLVNGVVPTILQIVVILSIVYSFVHEKYSRQGLLGAIALNNGSLFRTLLNKYLPYLIMFLTAILLFDIGMITYFKLPFRGFMGIEIISTIVFIISASLCATVLALWMPTRAMSYGVASIFASPAFGFIGLFYPRIMMDSFAIFWGNILPITWYMESRLDQTLRAVSLYQSLKPILIMCIIGVVAYILIVLRVLLMRKKARKNV